MPEVNTTAEGPITIDTADRADAPLPSEAGNALAPAPEPAL